jgi:hypothetical protein
LDSKAKAISKKTKQTINKTKQKKKIKAESRREREKQKENPELTGMTEYIQRCCCIIC